MKMKHKLLLLASVFFMLIVSSCGIPSTFYIDTEIESDKVSTITIKITDNNLNNLQDVTDGKGPSLFLAYIVTDKPVIDSTISSNIIKEFDKRYRRSPHGIQIDKPFDGGTILDSNDDTVKLFAFSGQNLSIPRYHATAQDPVQAQGSFTIELKNGAEEDLFYLLLTNNDIVNEYDINIAKLMRFNNTEFDLPGKANLDYVVEDETINRFCHIFAAINIGEGTTFDNIYWSQLTKVLSIELKPVN